MAAAVEPYFDDAIATPQLDFDRQAVFLSQARAASAAPPGRWSLVLRQLAFDGTRFAEVAALRLGGDERDWATLGDLWIDRAEENKREPELDLRRIRRALRR